MSYETGGYPVGDGGDMDGVVGSYLGDAGGDIDGVVGSYLGDAGGGRDGDVGSNLGDMDGDVGSNLGDGGAYKSVLLTILVSPFSFCIVNTVSLVLNIVQIRPSPLYCTTVPTSYETGGYPGEGDIDGEVGSNSGDCSGVGAGVE